MGTPRISTFIIGMIWISAFAVILGVFISSISVNYSTNYTTSNIEMFNKMDNLTAATNVMKSQTGNFSQPVGLLNVVDGYFNSGYRVLTLGLQSFDLFWFMLKEGISSINFGGSSGGGIGDTLFLAISATVIVILVFIIIKQITKTDV